MFNLSSEGADQLYTVANVAIAIGTAILLAATICSIWASSTKDKYAAIKQAQMDVLIAEANASSKKADARAADANLSAAKANERSNVLERDTAELQRQAEEARAETARVNERLRKLQEGRRLTPEQKQKLSDHFRLDIYSREPKVRIMVSASLDTESAIYAQDFIDLFLQCGIRTNPNFGLPHPRPDSFVQANDEPFDMVFSVSPQDHENIRQEFAGITNIFEDIGLTVALDVSENIEVNDSRLQILRKLKVT